MDLRNGCFVVARGASGFGPDGGLGTDPALDRLLPWPHAVSGQTQTPTTNISEAIARRILRQFQRTDVQRRLFFPVTTIKIPHLG
jgi:hypothetical protein